MCYRYNPLIPYVTDICDRSRQMVPYIEKCSFDWSQGHDSTDSYHDSWTREPASDVKVRHNYPWAYKSTIDVDGVPYAGEVSLVPSAFKHNRNLCFSLVFKITGLLSFHYMILLLHVLHISR